MSDTAAAGAHDSPEEIKKHIRGYYIVGMSLYAFTVITVLVAWVQLAPTAAIIVALGIATTKATLVALYFMHLIDEKKMIYSTLMLTAFFFILVMALPSMTVGNSLGDKMYQEQTEAHLHGHEAVEK